MQYQCKYPHILHIYICTRALCCTHIACNFNLPPHPLNFSINFFLLFPTSFGQRVGLAMFATATACRRKTKRNRPHMNTVSRHPTDGIRGLHKKIFNQHKYTCPNLTNIVTEQEGKSANAKRHAKDQAHCFLNVHGFHHSGTGYVRETIREMFPTQASTHNFGRVDRYPQQEGAWGSEALPGKRMITRALLPTGIYSNRGEPDGGGGSNGHHVTGYAAPKQCPPLGHKTVGGKKLFWSIISIVSDVRPNFLYHLPCTTRTPPVLKCRTVKNCNLPPPTAASSSSSSSSLATSLFSNRGSTVSTMEQQLTERVLATYTCPANVAARATAANKRVLLEDWMAGWNTSRSLLIQKTYVHDRQ